MTTTWKLSDAGVLFIERREGCKLYAYDDYDESRIVPGRKVRGTPTIGFGHTGPDTMRLSPLPNIAAADRLFRKDVSRDYENYVNAAVHRYGLTGRWDQGKHDGTTSFVYNLGIGMLLPSHDFGRHLQEGNLQAAANSMLEYINKGSVWEEGLTARREDERDMFLHGGTAVDSLHQKLEELRHEAHLHGWSPQLRNRVDQVKTRIRIRSIRADVHERGKWTKAEQTKVKALETQLRKLQAEEKELKK